MDPTTTAPAVLPSGADAEIDQPTYWHSLVGEVAAGEFLGLGRRTMQVMRQRGGGPRYIAISSRCIRYRRVDLKAWADSRLRRSTSDPGPA